VPQPTISDVHVNVPLTNLSIAYRQAPSGFVALRMSPPTPVNHKSDFIRVYTRADWFRSQMERRAPATESAGSGWTSTLQTYNAEVYALHKDISDQELANTDADIDLDRDATVWLTQNGLIKLDQQWTATCFTPGVWTGSTTGGDLVGGTNFTKFSAAGSTPIETIRSQIYNLTTAGIDPANIKLLIGATAWVTLADHPELVARLPVTTEKVFTPQTFATLLEIGEVIVGRSVVNTANEGATPAYSFIQGNAMLLQYVEPNAGPLSTTASRVLFWKGYLAGMVAGIPTGEGSMAGTAEIRKFRMEHLRSNRVEIEEAFTPFVTAPDLGVFFTAVV
jgi:hypothetical protein